MEEAMVMDVLTRDGEPLEKAKHILYCYTCVLCNRVMFFSTSLKQLDAQDPKGP
jgi:hypothetical protein